MPSLSAHIVNRVKKLPQPSSVTQGLQPLFEAVSNAFLAIEDRFGEDNMAQGRVLVEVDDLNNGSRVEILVADNGIGLDEDRYGAFCVVDTDFKKSKGGKGVGRLFWLDAFSNTTVSSWFGNGAERSERAFKFILSNDDQIVPIEGVQSPRFVRESGTEIKFSGLRTKEYSNHFPKRSDTFLRYFSAHFIADFLIGGGPQVNVAINGETTIYPDAVAELVVGPALETGKFDHDDFGELSIIGFFV